MRQGGSPVDSFCTSCYSLLSRISCHMFYGQRMLDIPDGKPKWTGLNDKSDLIEDSPPENVKELKRKREEESKAED